LYSEKVFRFGGVGWVPSKHVTLKVVQESGKGANKHDRTLVKIKGESQKWNLTQNRLTGLSYRPKGCYLLFTQHFVLKKLIIAQLVKKSPTKLTTESIWRRDKPNS